MAASFRSIAERQGGEKRTDTEAILAILEDKRVEVLDREEAGYFIRDRQEHRSGAADDIQDARYQEIKSIGRQDEAD